MKHFLTAGIAGVVLLGAAGFDTLRAQAPEKSLPAQAEPMMKSQPGQAEPTGPTDNQIANDVDARIALLKASLRLTVDQEKDWPGLQTVLHDYGIGQLKAALENPERPRRRDRDDHDRAERPNDIELLRKMADDLTARGASLKKLADAAEPLYASLDDRQKHDLLQFLRTDFEFHRH
jgi:hypothetical protein